ncbi:Transaldolase [Aspergillus mulundensis]|uniref:Transaldolase n=1 Tax=Aspergillus mulundensis TaxID=1810919 RepID=A0A3D8S5V0_9EURO|nr:Transaldolase [Aspergillus mulundensis]RDW81580.1 Transaldolase [Aspergillus mulundensis]
MDKSRVNLLEYLRSKTQVDLDTFDVTAVGAVGQCVDCTSNQYEYYTELAKPTRRDILEKTLEETARLHDLFPEVIFEELGVEVGAVLLAGKMVPGFTGNVHLMVNPKYAYSKDKVYANAKRFHHLFALIDPSYDRSRIVIKVPATWEGLQACRLLHKDGVKTLGTTLFCMEQAVLAGEAGCVSISPFVHRLKILVEPAGYKDPHPVYTLSGRAQRWYRQHGIRTMVKSCATSGIDELLQLAGIDALTIVPDDLRELERGYRDADEVAAMSIVEDVAAEEKTEYPSYIDDEAKYRADFEKADEGRAIEKTAEAIDIFCGYQDKAEEVIRKARK